jgi:hypothetical protein
MIRRLMRIKACHICEHAAGTLEVDTTLSATGSTTIAKIIDVSITAFLITRSCNRTCDDEHVHSEAVQLSKTFGPVIIA